jgi:hypothetical protein
LQGFAGLFFIAWMLFGLGLSGSVVARVHRRSLLGAILLLYNYRATKTEIRLVASALIPVALASLKGDHCSLCAILIASQGKKGHLMIDVENTKNSVSLSMLQSRRSKRR